MQNAAASPSIKSEERYLITSQLEILALLGSLKEQKGLILMRLHDSAQAIVTTILDIDAKNSSIIIDNSSRETFNQRATTVERIRFEATLNKIRIAFSSAQASPCVLDNRPALRVAFPQSMIRVQRRDAYRIDLLSGKPVTCNIPLPAAATAKARNVTLEIKDISSGGIALVDNERLLGEATGVFFKDCHIEFPGVGAISTTLRVVRSIEEPLVDDKKRRVLGCQFINLPNPMMILVLRYIGMMERRSNAKWQGYE
ncbi:MAG: flagellar brake protein [Candidimonas sp.]|nr:MAG: flagellar brake protein [Candidimonas sp.]TAM19643.1 MAG: flagellar brake protein [Candidimonas sp.]